MTFRRENDRWGKLNSKGFSVFRGSNYAYGKCDQPDVYAHIIDFAIRNEKLELRDGMRKNSITGYPATVDAVFNMAIGGVAFLGVVTNGVLTAYPVEDVIAAIRRYYTVRELRAAFTTSELTSEKVNDLIRKRPR